MTKLQLLEDEISKIILVGITVAPDIAFTLSETIT
jgi:hypothetical protein